MVPVRNIVTDFRPFVFAEAARILLNQRVILIMIAIKTIVAASIFLLFLGGVSAAEQSPTRSEAQKPNASTATKAGVAPLCQSPGDDCDNSHPCCHGKCEPVPGYLNGAGNCPPLTNSGIPFKKP